MDSQVIAEDLPEVISKLSDINRQITESTSHINALLTKVKSNEYDTTGGLSFLEMKFHLLLEYLINLSYTMLLKVDGRNIDGAPVIDRLVEIRTVIEKLRPIDKKLKYQMDKLLAMASSDTSASGKHPLSFKPNIDMLESKFDNEENNEEESEAESGTDNKTGVYVPPRVSAVPYDDELDLGKKGGLSMENVRKRALNSSLLKDLRDEFSEEPEEIRDDYKSMKRNKMKEIEQDRERFEEDNLRRLQVTKKDKQTWSKINEIDEISKIDRMSTGFGNESDSDEEFDQPKKKKSKGSSYKKGDKGGKKGLKKHKKIRRK